MGGMGGVEGEGGESPLSCLTDTAVARVLPSRVSRPHTYSIPSSYLHTSSLQDVTDLALKMVQLVQARMYGCEGRVFWACVEGGLKRCERRVFSKGLKTHHRPGCPTDILCPPSASPPAPTPPAALLPGPGVGQWQPGTYIPLPPRRTHTHTDPPSSPFLPLLGSRPAPPMHLLAPAPCPYPPSQALGQRHPGTYIVDVFKGSRSKAVSKHGHDAHPLHGCGGTALSKPDAGRLLRQLVVAGVLREETFRHDNQHGTIASFLVVRGEGGKGGE